MEWSAQVISEIRRLNWAEGHCDVRHTTQERAAGHREGSQALWESDKSPLNM